MTEPQTVSTPEPTWIGGPFFRKSSTTHDEFSTAWLRHGQLVAPWFLANGVVDYIQINLPDFAGQDQPSAGMSDAQALLRTMDGVVCVRHFPGSLPWWHPYYNGVVLPDERRFLSDESGSSPVKRNPPARRIPAIDIAEWRQLALEVGGVEHAIISDGKANLDIPDWVAQEWKRWSS